MKVEEGSIIELENGKEYFVAGLIVEDFKAYLYLVGLNVEEDKDIMFVSYDDERVYPVEDEAILEKLLKAIEERNRPKE